MTSHCGMMTSHSLGVNVECVGGARMFVVVDHRSDERREYLQVGQAARQTTLREQVVGRLRHVGCVDEVVVRIAVQTVALFETREEGFQGNSVHLRSVQEIQEPDRFTFP